MILVLHSKEKRSFFPSLPLSVSWKSLSHSNNKKEETLHFSLSLHQSFFLSLLFPFLQARRKKVESFSSSSTLSGKNSREERTFSRREKVSPQGENQERKVSRKFSFDERRKSDNFAPKERKDILQYFDTFLDTSRLFFSLSKKKKSRRKKSSLCQRRRRVEERNLLSVGRVKEKEEERRNIFY